MLFLDCWAPIKFQIFAQKFLKMSLNELTFKIEKRSNNEYVGDNDCDSHDEDDARLGKTLQRKHDSHVIVGVRAGNDHNRGGVPVRIVVHSGNLTLTAVEQEEQTCARLRTRTL